jgi:hypothetical protein
MRLGRIILAGLAPLVSLSAFAASWIPDAIHSKSPQHVAPTDSLLRAAVPVLISAGESAAPRENSAPHARLTLQALTTTPFRSSLWLVASLVAVDLLVRRHQRALLRC